MLDEKILSDRLLDQQILGVQNLLRSHSAGSINSVPSIYRNYRIFKANQFKSSGQATKRGGGGARGTAKQLNILQIIHYIEKNIILLLLNLNKNSYSNFSCFKGRHIL